MATDEKPIAVLAIDAPKRLKPSVYPEPFASLMAQRTKRPLGDLFGLTNFGVNLTTITPGGISALRHAHSTQDEFVYIVSGTATLLTNDGKTQLTAGMCAGFKAGSNDAHQIANEAKLDLVYLEVGDRSADDHAVYPDDDIQASYVDGGWRFTHKDGRPY